MKTVWKYTLALKETNVIEMPKDAKIKYVSTQHGNCCLWVEVETENFEVVSRAFDIFGTGHVQEDIVGGHRDYRGTFFIDDGALVFHVYEVIEE